MGKYQLDDKQKKLDKKYAGHAFPKAKTKKEKIELLKNMHIRKNEASSTKG
ncbi:MAG: hypothetical protein LBD38_02855 [Streptococcaceae bacterium]|jgi:hypothetical protein|nr:hypothetical protein [Streptococcaceae bacterium]